MDIMGVKHQLAAALRELVNEGTTFANGRWGPAEQGWSTVKLQVVMGTRTMFTMFTDLGEVSGGIPTQEVIDEVTQLCEAQRAESDSRPLVVEMTLTADGEVSVTYSLNLTSESLAEVVIDPAFRWPGHPAPGMPQPTSTQLSDAPTDPAALTAVSGLVRDFAEQYARITGAAPGLSEGYSEEAILAAETSMGLRLPEEIRALYRTTGTVASEWGLLGRYSPYSLGRVVEIYHEELPGAFNWREEFLDDDPVIFDTVPPGRVKRLSRNDWWVVFAGDSSGNDLAVDLDPAEDGRAGQVIEHLRDDDGAVRYVSGSVVTMLSQVVAALRADKYERPFGDNDTRLFTSNGFEDFSFHYRHSERLTDLGEAHLADVVAELAHPQQVQQLTISDPGSLDLAALASLGNLRQLVVSCGAVRTPLPACPSLEALSLRVSTVDIESLLRHPRLWDLNLSGLDGPVTIQPLSAAPALTRLNLVGVDVQDIESLTEFPHLRALTLNQRQWRTLRESGYRPDGLAIAETTGHAPLADTLVWAAWLQGRPQPELPLL